MNLFPLYLKLKRFESSKSAVEFYSGWDQHLPTRISCRSHCTCTLCVGIALLRLMRSRFESKEVLLMLLHVPHNTSLTIIDLLRNYTKPALLSVVVQKYLGYVKLIRRIADCVKHLINIGSSWNFRIPGFIFISTFTMNDSYQKWVMDGMQKLGKW